MIWNGNEEGGGMEGSGGGEGGIKGSVEGMKGSEVVACTSWDYDTSVFSSTITMEWDLVCDRAGLSSLFQSLYTTGCFVGAIVSAVTASRFGRRWCVRMGTAVTLFGVILMTVTPWLTCVFIARVMLGFATSHMIYPSFVMAMESCVPSMRATMGVILALPYALMMVGLSALAYVIRDWRTLHSVASFPSIILIPAVLLVDESPRWLLVHGRVNEVVKILERAAMLHKVKLPDKQTLINILTNSIQDCKETKMLKDGHSGTSFEEDETKRHSKETKINKGEIMRPDGQEKRPSVLEMSQNNKDVKIDLNEIKDTGMKEKKVESTGQKKDNSDMVKGTGTVKKQNTLQENIGANNLQKQNTDQENKSDNQAVFMVQENSDNPHLQDTGQDYNSKIQLQDNVNENNYKNILKDTLKEKTNSQNQLQDPNSIQVFDILNQDNTACHVIDLAMKNGNGTTLGLEDGQGAWWAGPIALVRTPVVRKIMLTLITMWILQGVVYLGLPLSSDAFSSPFLYMGLLGVVEIPAYSLTAPITHRLGRRPVVIFCLIASGLLLVLETALTIMGVHIEWVSIGLIMLSYMFVCTGYQVNFLYAPELLPTTLRLWGTSLCSLSAYIGFSIPPFVTDYLATEYGWVASLIFGFCGLIAGSLALLLPETNGRPLPETVKDLTQRLQTEKLVRKKNMKEKEIVVAG